MDVTRRSALAAGAVALLVAGGAIVAVGASADPAPVEPVAAVAPIEPGSPSVAGDWPVVTTTTALPNLDPATGIGVSEPIGPPWPDRFTVADAIVPQVPIFEAPNKPVPTGRTLPNPTVEGYDLVMLVREQRKDWLKVQINTRPNGATVWVRSQDVALRTVEHHIVIELGAKRLTAYKGDEPVFTRPVAPGKAATPTPLGAFYVDIRTRPTNPNGPYGAYQISVTGFSEVYDSFGGGNGQIAIHGTNRPELIGTPASNGCVRMSNEDITALLEFSRQGTPVTIVA